MGGAKYSGQREQEQGPELRSGSMPECRRNRRKSSTTGADWLRESKIEFDVRAKDARAWQASLNTMDLHRVVVVGGGGER